MTNASKVNFSYVLCSLALAVVLSFGAFTSIAHADDVLGYYGDSGGDWGGGDVLGYYGDSGGDVLGYYGDGGDVLGGYGDGDVLGYYGDGDVLGSYGDGDILGYYGDDSILGSYGCGFSDCGFESSCGYDCFNSTCDYGCFEENGIEYSYSDRFAQQSCFTCSSQSAPQRFASTPPISVQNPSFPSYPPSRPPSFPPQQPPRPQPSVFSNPSSNANTNVNTNTVTNTNVNNIDNSNNSINGSFNSNVTTLGHATPQYPVQYVFPQPVLPPPTYQNAYCTISASPSYVQNGQPAFLTWTSYGATSAWLSDGIGTVAPNGSLAVRPSGSTNYTLTVSGYGGTRTCSTYVNVSGTYVSLSQIPYTGFDFGAFGNALYWLGLVSFAGASAYLVLYYKGGASLFAGSLLGNVKFARENSARTAAPAMFASSFAKATEDRQKVSSPSAHTARAFSPSALLQDSMTLEHSEEGEGPRIVVTRS